MTQGRYILALQCPDAVGIVAAAATLERRVVITGNKTVVFA